MKDTGLFRRTRRLESQIDEFFDSVSEACLTFQSGFKNFLDDDPGMAFDDTLNQVSDAKSRSDELRREIETQLYEHTLIPELRADVLSLLEDMDGLVDVCQANCYRFSIEEPDIPTEFHRDFLNLTDTSVTCVDCVVMAGRAFFRNIEAVRDHTHKAVYLEIEADKINTRLKRNIFQSDLSLERKIHLRYFAERLDLLANRAEDIANRLAVFIIKRSL